MIAEQSGNERANSKTIERWSAYLEEVHSRIARHFSRPEVRERAYRYLGGLLEDVGRKNLLADGRGHRRGETTRGPTPPQRRPLGPQRRARRPARVRGGAPRGDEQSGVLVVDETGFLKKGNKSVGVARQYTGTAGKRENCQVGVFVCYCSKEGAAFVDRALYLPEEWTDDPRRLSEAGVPEGSGFATKGQLAKAMLQRAFEAGVPARWVVAYTVYGMTSGLRGWLEGRGRSYVLAVTSSKSVYHERATRGGSARWPKASLRSPGCEHRPVREPKASVSTIGLAS